MEVMKTRLSFYDRSSGPTILLIITASIAMVLSSKAKAQNLNFSQYLSAPFFVNPAVVASKSEVALSVLHRSQPLTASQKYNTSSVMLVAPLLNGKQTKRWGGWGLSVFNDEIKGAIDFRTQGIVGAYAYNLPVSSKRYFSFGMQAGYNQRKTGLNGLSTSSQWIDNVGYVPTLGTGENVVEGRKNFVTLSTGLLYYVEDDDQRHVAKFGVAAFNVNGPDVSQTQNRDVIPVKISAHGSVALMRSGQMLIHGEMLYYRENYKNTYHVATRLGYYFENNNAFDGLRSGSVDVQMGYRVNNAITTCFQFNQPNFTVAFEYDFGLSTEESYARPNDVVEFLFSLKKIIRGKKIAKANKPQTYTTLGKVREFYYGESRNLTDAQAEQIIEEVNPDSVTKGNFKLKHDFKFGFNEASLNDESKAYLDDLVMLLKGNTVIRLDVIGHTDDVGSSAANRKVSIQRAQVVIDYLLSKGVDPSKLKGVYMGAKEPLVPNENEANRALNRRVEFVIYNP